MARWQKYSCCAVHAYMQYSVVDGLWSAVRIDEIEYPHVPRKSPSWTSARRTFPNTNQGVDVRDNCYQGRDRCRGDKCQITRGVSAYDECAVAAPA